MAPLTHGVFRRSANAKALRLLRDKVIYSREQTAKLDLPSLLMLGAHHIIAEPKQWTQGITLVRQLIYRFIRGPLTIHMFLALVESLLNKKNTPLMLYKVYAVTSRRKMSEICDQSINYFYDDLIIIARKPIYLFFAFYGSIFFFCSRLHLMN